MLLRDAARNNVLVDDVLESLAFPQRRVRVVAIADTFITLSPIGWLPAEPNDDGLIRVKRTVWNAVGCWVVFGMAGACEETVAGLVGAMT